MWKQSTVQKTVVIMQQQTPPHILVQFCAEWTCKTTPQNKIFQTAAAAEQVCLLVLKFKFDK